MKIIGIIVVFFVLAMGFSFMRNQKVGEGKGISFFEGTLEEAMALAKKEKKSLFLDAYASWCGPCKMMSNRVFPSTKVGEFFNANFINIKIDMEKGEGPQIAEMLKVNSYPSLFFIDFNGEVTTVATGYHTTNQLIKLGQEVLD